MKKFYKLAAIVGISCTTASYLTCSCGAESVSDAPTNSEKKVQALRPMYSVAYDSGSSNVMAYIVISDAEMIIVRFLPPIEYRTIPADKQSGKPSDEQAPYKIVLKNVNIQRLTGPDVRQHIYHGGAARPIPEDGSHARHSSLAGTAEFSGQRGSPNFSISLHNIDFGDGKLYETSSASFDKINIPVP